MSLHLAPFQPYGEDKNRINAVPEAIALNSAYRPLPSPFVLSAAMEAGAAPVVERPNQSKDGIDAQITDYLATA